MVPVAIPKDADVPVAAGFVTVPVVFGAIVAVFIVDFIVVPRVLIPMELPVDFFSVVVACMVVCCFVIAFVVDGAAVVGCFVSTTVDAASVAGFFVVSSIDTVVDVNVAAFVVVLETGDEVMPLSTCVMSANDASASMVVWSAAIYVHHKKCNL